MVYFFMWHTPCQIHFLTSDTDVEPASPQQTLQPHDCDEDPKQGLSYAEKEMGIYSFTLHSNTLVSSGSTADIQEHL
jgi:hypothetical protein